MPDQSGHCHWPSPRHGCWEWGLPSHAATPDTPTHTHTHRHAKVVKLVQRQSELFAVGNQSSKGFLQHISIQPLLVCCKSAVPNSYTYIHYRSNTQTSYYYILVQIYT